MFTDWWPSLEVEGREVSNLFEITKAVTVPYAYTIFLYNFLQIIPII